MARESKQAYAWKFKSRFRRNAFGWRGSRPAIERIHEALAEIDAVARTDRNLAAEGAVVFIERVSPALEQIDSSSGAIGSAVNGAIVDLVPIIAGAPAERRTREKWLDRLWAAHEADAIPYIETLADYWGELCASKELASEWADHLIGITRMALSPDPKLRAYFHGASACFSALFRAERYAEIIDMLQTEKSWHYTQWAVKALAARGEKAEAIWYAESRRSPSTPDGAVDRRRSPMRRTSDTAAARIVAEPTLRLSALFRRNIRTSSHRRFSPILPRTRRAKKGSGLRRPKTRGSTISRWISPAEVRATRGRWRARPETSRNACPSSQWKRVCSVCTGSSRATDMKSPDTRSWTCSRMRCERRRCGFSRPDLEYCEATTNGGPRPPFVI